MGDISIRSMVHTRYEYASDHEWIQHSNATQVDDGYEYSYEYPSARLSRDSLSCCISSLFYR